MRRADSFRIFVATNVIGGAGRLWFTNAIAPGVPQRFFLRQAP